MGAAGPPLALPLLRLARGEGRVRPRPLPWPPGCPQRRSRPLTGAGEFWESPAQGGGPLPPAPPSVRAARRSAGAEREREREPDQARARARRAGAHAARAGRTLRARGRERRPRALALPPGHLPGPRALLAAAAAATHGSGTR